MLIGRAKPDSFSRTLRQGAYRSPGKLSMSTKPTPLTSPLTSYQVRLLAVLALINFVNFADRQVIVPLVPLLRAHLGISDAQLGSLQTWLLVILAIASIPFGFLADRFSRKQIIAGGIVFWSMATFAGLIPGIAVLWLEEPLRGPRSEVVPLSRILSVPAFVAMIVAGVFITFSSVSLLTWGIDFAVNYKDFSLREAAVSLALIALFSLVFGVLMGGWAADRLQRRFVYGRIMAIMGAFLLAAPFLLLAIEAEEKWTVLTGLFVAGFFMSWYHGPVTAVIHDMMPRRAHATSVGVYMFVTQLVGALGPQVVGRISDLRDLQLGLQICVAVMVAGALLMLVVIHFIRRDGIRHPVLDAFHAEPGD